MSLLLRQELQSQLDAVGLDNFHVTLNRFHQVAIVGECGESLVVVKGVATNGPKVTLKERAFIGGVLFPAFLTKYLGDIRKLIKLKKKAKALGVVWEAKDPKTYHSWKQSTYGSPSYGEEYGIYYHDGNGSITVWAKIQHKAKISDVKNDVVLRSADSTLSVDEASKWKYSKVMYKHALEELASYHKYLVTDLEFNQAQAELSSCSI